ncbi:MAG TPA: M13 family metallopeptidase, partial [Steroidobacteraceae bacterium]|nr:M13 family metallopeptidase [Steroidobacteraceae bacterium]
MSRSTPPVLLALSSLLALCSLAACSLLHHSPPPARTPGAAPMSEPAPSPAPAASPAPAPLGSGIDTQYEDKSVRPQDDIYRYLNGKWLDEFEIPADKGVYVSFSEVDDRTQEQLHSIIDALSSPAAAASSDPTARKLADLFASFMNEAHLDELGLEPLKPTLAAVGQLRSKRQIPALIARFNRQGIDAPYDVGVTPDPKDSTRYAVSVGQSGLGMPDRDYYLKEDPKLKSVREQYLKHIERMLRLAGERRAPQEARSILKLETALARQQWTRVENRDPVKTYNKFAIADLEHLTPGFDWRPYLADSRFSGKIDYLIVQQPSYLKGLDHLIASTPLPVWRSYFRWQVLASAAPYLSKPFVDEQFAFAGTVVRGIPQNRPRWKRGLSLLNESLGEALGKLYVEKYFPPPYKERMQALVHQLIVAYGRDIDRLDWMSDVTRRGAHEKLAKLVTKIGYPDKWRDYSALVIERDDLWGNVVRATEFEFAREVAKLGQPIDRQEWFMTPQTVNAYYNPLMNEIVFPAAILQPPFFNAQADDAVNYGAIGAVIGHEISHAFDDEGSQFDAEGNLRDWFAPEDHAKFAAKTKALIAQYETYSPVPGFHVNGRLTLGENIADNSGLAIAYQAYHLSLEGHAAPVIDGLTGDQRFYLGFAQVWRGKAREGEAISRIKTDPHSPPQVRGAAPLRN